jgi:preprotein translocase subunit Sec63
MFLNDSLLDKRVITTSPSVVACACLYLGIKIHKEYSSSKANILSKNDVYDKEDQWWVKLSINEDNLYNTADWITEVSLSVSKDSVLSQRII